MEGEFHVIYHRMEVFRDMFSEYYDQSMSNFHRSLSPKFNREMIFKAGEGAGRSGSFFFYSHDRRWIIKTMSSGELKLFLSCLDKFAAHYKANKSSLLAKIFGVFTVETSRMKQVHIMLMENTMRMADPENLRYIFDLKGSRVDRKVKGKTKSTTCLKDENFRQISLLKNNSKRNLMGSRFVDLS